jgi:two-component system, NarL family, response regulator NreC
MQTGDWTMKKEFSIVIAEDHPIFRKGLKDLLFSKPDLKVVAEATDGIEAIHCVQNHSPDLVIMDLSMPRISGLGAMQEIKRVAPQTKIIVLTVHKTDEYILAALQAGADGYISKEANSTELLTAIQTVLNGVRYLSPSVSSTIVDAVKREIRESATRSAWEALTQREREVFKLIAEGQKNREIAIE